jgi:hypothetical protein
VELQTLAHAVMLLRDGEGRPLLATDPWITGSTYWRSWWVENYPTAAQIEQLAACRWIYITHEHPDHLHPPSLRQLGKGAEILLPDFLSLKMAEYLEEQGWKTRRLPARRWVDLQPGLSVMALPTWNNDSILLVTTPDALIVNMNDAKPGRRVMEQVGALRQALGKRCILLRSYSPAGPANSYFRQGKRILPGKDGFLSAVQNACRRIGADLFIPFASQVIFRRPDTDWANDHKVRYRDLMDHWQVPETRLLPPYSTVPLAGGEPTSQNPADFKPGVSERTQVLVAQQQAANAAAHWDEDDHQRLEQQLRSLNLLLRRWYPRGFDIQADGQALGWDPAAGRLLRTRRPDGHFTLRLPLLPLKEAVQYGHMGDLSIPMFTSIDLAQDCRPEDVDRFFMLLILRDYGYLGGYGRFFRWLLWIGRGWLASRRALPLPR